MRPRKPDFPARVVDLRSAPGDLAIIQAFVNTVDREHGTDVLGSPEALGDWLSRHGLPVAKELGAADLERAIEAREVLRLALLINTGAEPSAKTVSRLDRTASTIPIFVRFSEGARLQLAGSSEGLEGALGRLFAIVASEQLGGQWRRLKACANPACNAAFYDFSSNRSGRWCSMRRCGVRLHSRRHQRQLRRQGAGR